MTDVMNFDLSVGEKNNYSLDADIGENASLGIGEDGFYLLEADLEENTSLGMDTSITIIHTGGDEYKGEYIITPKADESQTLPTRYKTLARDVLVKEIPYHETTNLSGGYTVNIG